MTGPNIATLGLQLNTSGLKSGSAQAVQMFSAIQAAATGTTKGLASLQQAISAVGGAFAALKLGGMAQELLSLGARYETLGVVLKTVGVNAGYTEKFISQLQISLQKTGISMLASRQVITQFIQSQLSLTQATKLARVAQDAAVVANQNSSDTLLQIVHAIQSGQSRILQNIGLNLSWQKSYEDLARSMHITVEQLSVEEKTQARVNAVMEAGKGIAGSYESAMTTAGKQVLSMQRYVENLKVQLSQAFLPLYTKAVFAFAEALKKANEHLALLQGILGAGALVAGILALAGAFRVLAWSIGLTNPLVAAYIILIGVATAVAIASYEKLQEEAAGTTQAMDDVTTAMYGEATAAQTLSKAIKDLDANRTKTSVTESTSLMMSPPEGFENIDEAANKKELVNMEMQRLEISRQLALSQGRVLDAEKIAMQAHMVEFSAQIEANQNLWGVEKSRAIELERQKYALEQITDQLQKNLALQREIARHSNTGNLVPAQQGGTGYGSGGPTTGVEGPNQQGQGYSYERGPNGEEGFRDAMGIWHPVRPHRGLPELTSTAQRPGAQYSYGNEVGSVQAASGPNYGSVLGTGQGILQGSKSSGLREEADAQRIDKQRALAEQFTAIWLNAVTQIQEGIGHTFEEILTGQIQTLKQFATSLLTLIRDIFAKLAAAYATSLVTKLIGGPLVQAASSMGGVPLARGSTTQSMAAGHHTGGTAGALANVRFVDPSVFTEAYRYHTGGVAGLKPGEVPAILERGERIIPRGGRLGGNSITVYQTVNQNLSAVDGDSAARFLMQNGHIVAGIVAQAAQDVPGYAAALRGS